MKREEIRKYQLAQLDILKFVDKLCRENSITYYMCFGTLIGAVRHNGFIPWDADIDIVMFRDDYEKFRKLMTSIKNSCVFYDHYDTNRNHISVHSIIRIPETHVISNNINLGVKNEINGIYIDVFPLDNIPNNKSEQEKMYKKIHFLNRLIILKQAPVYAGDTSTLKRYVKRLISALLTVVSFRSVQEKLDAVMSHYKNKNTDKVAVLLDPGVFKAYSLQFERSWFGEPIELMFENGSFLAPSKYVEILSNRYGDYMKLPPEKERWNYLDKEISSIEYGHYNVGDLSSDKKNLCSYGNS